MSGQTTIWRLRGFVDEARCEMRHEPYGCSIGLTMGDQLILEEAYVDEDAALSRAGALRRRLVERGWQVQRPS